MQRRADTLMGERIIMGFDAKKYAAFGVELLENGYDSENIRILAGLDHDDSWAVDQYFGMAAHELGIDMDAGPEKLLQKYAASVAEKVIDGQMVPENAVHIMYNLYMAADYDRRYSIFMELDDALSSLEYNEYPHTYPELTRDNQNEIFIKEFKKFLEEQK